MSIQRIAETINKLALRDSHPIGNMPKLRAAIKGKNRFRNQIFSEQTIFDSYAFHHGGRSEIQFNIGEDTWHGKSFFRYGLSISFEPNRNLPHPIPHMLARVNAFNHFVTENPGALTGLEMAHFAIDTNKDFQTWPIQSIPENWIVKDNFIQIGQFFDKSAAEVTDQDIELILSTFDKLLPVYQYVESSPIEERYARICWNTEGWRKPSGREGKSQDKGSYEYQTGFGHEEWVFDLEKTIDGYHFSLLRPVDTHRASHVGKTYNVTLYTREESTNQEYWIGKIKNLHVLTREESEEAFERYREQGWIEEIRQQILAVGAELTFRGTNVLGGESFFNVKFRPEDVELFDGYPIPIVDKPENMENATRYTFLHKNEMRNVNAQVSRITEFSPNKPLDSEKVGNTIAKTFIGRQAEYDNLHSSLQNGFHHYLESKYPGKTEREALSGNGGSKIDLKFQDADGEFVFFEVKSYPNLMQSIRVAVGQLMEYAYFPRKNQAKSLVIVSHQEASQEIENYLSHLGDTFGIPLGYIRFDHRKNRIIQRINCTEI